ncbi:hypothetical protein PTE30175_02362 [Pandoraea terrae]|uniref:Uncharacterized protein n=1 Tax=Pandoraea terrae TaxID=1537710 RepID=A0A5E4V7H3_9BURK|nr:hypothetical protein [Pandoraea terrae]VVE06975.1 hypothetical protein PTE30175_02362 [Pandoraea terrae]
MSDTDDTLDTMRTLARALHLTIDDEVEADVATLFGQMAQAAQRLAAALSEQATS